jgi:hypothetical protein
VDAIKGMLPLAHAACTVVKIHGDYRDARILNTVAELSKYRPAMNTLLDRIFDEYGLIVCGWSGESDLALCAALQRRRSRRYTTYWTVRDHMKDEAQRLIDHLKAETIQISGADPFFRNLSESVKAIEDTVQPHPLSAKVAEATVKRYVVDDRYRVLLNDLVIREATRVYESITGPSSPSLYESMAGPELERRLAFYQGQAQTLMAMMVAGCYWGEEHHHRLWGRAIQRVSRFASLPGARYDEATYLRLYPALLALYAGGMASVAADRYDTLAALLLQDGWPDPRFTGSLPMAVHLSPTRPLSGELVKKVTGYANRSTPTSDYLFWGSGLLEATRNIRWDDADYRSLFDWFEFFLGLVTWDLTAKMWSAPWIVRGAFQFTDNRSGKAETMKPVQRFESEINAMGDEWTPLKAGFFSGSLERATEVANAYLGRLEGTC